MKWIPGLTLLFMICVLPACKKKDTTTTNTNVRTGLGLLVDPKATNYCVLIEPGGYAGDTLIWEDSSHGDVMAITGGVLYSPYDRYYANTTFWRNSDTMAYKEISFLFQMPESYGTASPACGFIDSIMKLGTYPATDTNFIFYIADNSWNWTSVLYGTQNGTITIESMTPIISSTGCPMLRVKATLSGVIYSIPDCVPNPYVKQGEFVMDFAVSSE